MVWSNNHRSKGCWSQRELYTNPSLTPSDWRPPDIWGHGSVLVMDLEAKPGTNKDHDEIMKHNWTTTIHALDTNLLLFSDCFLLDMPGLHRFAVNLNIVHSSFNWLHNLAQTINLIVDYWVKCVFFSTFFDNMTLFPWLSAWRIIFKSWFNPKVLIKGTYLNILATIL